MHVQPVFHVCAVVGGGVAETLFERGLCLPLFLLYFFVFFVVQMAFCSGVICEFPKMLLRELASRIVIDPRKLLEYALNPDAPRGRHKALVFAQVLGYTLDNWQHLLSELERR